MPKTIKGQSKSLDFLKSLLGHQSAPCVKWPFGTNPNGYGQMAFRGRTTYAHRVMCTLAHGEPEPKMEAAHLCGNGHQGCVNPKHLAWKTKKENRRDSNRHGKGGRHGYGIGGKLTEEQVAEIHASKGIIRNVDLAAKFGVSWTTINSIQNGHSRKREPKIKLWKPDEVTALRDALAKGGNYLPDLVRIVGRSGPSISQYCHKHGLSIPRRPISMMTFKKPPQQHM